MARDPAFLFYSSDFLTGVSDLTFEERGQYITLLCLQHQKGRLSKKAISIAVANAAADVLAKFEIDENGLYFNPRLEMEAEKRAQHAEKQRQRALEGWKKRKSGQSPGNTVADAAALPLENENVNRDVSSKFNFKLSLIEAGGKKDLVEDWMKVRKDKKASNTKTALRSFLNEIAQNQLDLNQVLEICISNSWKGFKANWIKDEKPNGLDILREINKANGI